MWFKKKKDNSNLMITDLDDTDLKQDKISKTTNQDLATKSKEWNEKSLLKAKNDAELDLIWTNNHIKGAFSYLQKQGFNYSNEELLLRKNFLWFLNRFNLIIDYTPKTVYQIMGDYDFFSNIDVWRINAKTWYESLILNKEDYEAFLQQHTNYKNLNDNYADFQRKPLTLDILTANVSINERQGQKSIQYILEFFQSLSLILSENEWKELIKEAKKLNRLHSLTKEANFRVFLAKLAIIKLKEVLGLFEANFGKDFQVVKYLYLEQEPETQILGVPRLEPKQLKHIPILIIKDDNNNYYQASWDVLNKPFNKADVKQLTSQEVANISLAYNQDIIKLNKESYTRFRVSNGQSANEVNANNNLANIIHPKK